MKTIFVVQKKQIFFDRVESESQQLQKKIKKK